MFKIAKKSVLLFIFICSYNFVGHNHRKYSQIVCIVLGKKTDQLLSYNFENWICLKFISRNTSVIGKQSAKATVCYLLLSSTFDWFGKGQGLEPPVPPPLNLPVLKKAGFFSWVSWFCCKQETWVPQPEKRIRETWFSPGRFVLEKAGFSSMYTCNQVSSCIFTRVCMQDRAFRQWKKWS